MVLGHRPLHAATLPTPGPNPPPPYPTVMKPALPRPTAVTNVPQHPTCRALPPAPNGGCLRVTPLGGGCRLPTGAAASRPAGGVEGGAAPDSPPRSPLSPGRLARQPFPVPVGEEEEGGGGRGRGVGQVAAGATMNLPHRFQLVPRTGPGGGGRGWGQGSCASRTPQAQGVPSRAPPKGF